MPLEAYSPGTLTVTIGADPVTTLVLELGTPGPQGQTGAQGATGAGIPVGGTAGQVLAKIDGTNYNTEWITKNGGVWGQITGTLSNQTDLQNALNAKYDASNPSGYITTSALAPYLLSSTASSTYLTQANASSTYLTQANASSTYLTISNAASTYFPKPTGTSAEYIDGTGALQTFPTVTTAGKMVTNVRNNTGATLTKGTVVYINGAAGNKPTVTKAQAHTEPTSKATFGLVESNINDNSDGNIIVIGLLENVDTQGFADGTLIYLSPFVAGGWTSTQPFSPYHYVGLGTVIRGNHPTQGSVQVRVQNGFQLDEMSDVGAVSPVNNNVLTWNAGTSQWLDKSVSTILGYTPADDSLVLKKASNLSDLANAGTARTNLGVAYATDAQVIAGTSTTNVVSPSNVSAIRPINRYTRDFDFGVATWTTHSSGTPFIIQSAWAKSVINQTNVGFGALSFSITPNFTTPTGGNVSYLNFDASYEITFTVTWSESTTSNDSIKRLGVGKNGSTYVAGDLTVKGFNVRRIGRGVLELQVHNGTTLTTVASTFNPGTTAGSHMSEIKLTSNGLGTCTLWANGTQIASTTGAPTGSSGILNNRLFLENQVLATLTTAHQLETYAWRVSRSF